MSIDRSRTRVQGRARRAGFLAVAIAGLVVIAAAGSAAHAADAGVKVTPLVVEPMANAPGKTLSAVTVDYAPGAASGPHRHPASGIVFVYVVSGAVRSQVEGGPLRVYHAGQSWVEPPNAHHVVSANASRTRPARIVAVVIADTGVPTTVYDK